MRSWRVLLGAACTAYSETCDKQRSSACTPSTSAQSPTSRCDACTHATCTSCILAQSLTNDLRLRDEPGVYDGTGACPGWRLMLGYIAQPIHAPRTYFNGSDKLYISDAAAPVYLHSDLSVTAWICSTAVTGSVFSKSYPYYTSLSFFDIELPALKKVARCMHRVSQSRRWCMPCKCVLEVRGGLAFLVIAYVEVRGATNAPSHGLAWTGAGRAECRFCLGTLWWGKFTSRHCQVVGHAAHSPCTSPYSRRMQCSRACH